MQNKISRSRSAIGFGRSSESGARWTRKASFAVASAALEPARPAAWMLPSAHTAGRIRSGFNPIVASQTSRPFGVRAIDDTRTRVGYSASHALSWAVSRS